MQLNPLRPLRQRGVGLIDALVAMSLLGIGMLGMSRMQGRLIVQGSEMQVRLAASRAADELLGMVIADSANAACYTAPATGTCTSTMATASASAWKTATLVALPTHSRVPPTATVTLDSTSGLFKVVLTWPAKAGTLGGESIQDVHKLTVATDVRQ